MGLEGQQEPANWQRDLDLPSSRGARNSTGPRNHALDLEPRKTPPTYPRLGNSEDWRRSAWARLEAEQRQYEEEQRSRDKELERLS